MRSITSPLLFDANRGEFLPNSSTNSVAETHDTIMPSSNSSTKTSLTDESGCISYQTPPRPSNAQRMSGTSTFSADKKKTMTSPVKSLVAGVVHAVETHRKKKRISQALLTLRAANRVLEDQKLQKRQDDEDDSLTSDESDDWGHDVASALFSPLERRYPSHTSLNRLHDKDQTDTRDDPPVEATAPLPIPAPAAAAAEEEEEKMPVRILPEHEALLRYNPRLLTQNMFEQLMDDGVPECLRMSAWERIYSIGRDGDSFRTLLAHCRNYQYTIVVVQTTTGHLLGGFASDVWRDQGGKYSKRKSYYGTGVSFLFASHPNTGDDGQAQQSSDPDKPLSIYNWTGRNDFCQICDRDKSVLAMGGSGAFGFILEDDFYKGSTDRCGTFGNPPLTPDKDGIFEVAAMEVYGLVPFGLLDHSSPSSISGSPRSTADPEFNIKNLTLYTAPERTLV